MKAGGFGVAAEGVGLDPVRPVFEFLGPPAGRGVTWAWARRDLDLDGAPAARRELTGLLAADARPDWVLVFLGVECFVGLHGLRMLVDVAALLRTRGGELVVVAPPRCLLLMIRVTGLGAGLCVTSALAPR